VWLCRLLDSKEGRQWFDFLVLPESAVVAMRRKATEENLLPPAGSAADEWKRLSMLMKLLDQATVLWGMPSDMYGVNEKVEEAKSFGMAGKMGPEELEKEARAMRFFLHPNGERLTSQLPNTALPTLARVNLGVKTVSAGAAENFRTLWDLVQVVLLLYLLVIVPLRVAFDVELDAGSPAFWLDVCVDIYFLVVRNR
jgi:hypothetical protein